MNTKTKKQISSSERYQKKKQDLQEKIANMTLEEKAQYEAEKRKKQDEANFKCRENIDYLNKPKNVG